MEDLTILTPVVLPLSARCRASGSCNWTPCSGTSRTRAQWLGKMDGKPMETPIFHGENPWFPVKFFSLTNPVTFL